MPTLRCPSRRAFTLLEIVLVVFLLMMLLAAGVPSMRGQLARHKLQGAFDRFDLLAAEAQKRSVTDGEPYVLAWQRDGTIRLYPVAWNAEQRRTREPAAHLAARGIGRTVYPGAGQFPLDPTRRPSGRSGPAAIANP